MMLTIKKIIVFISLMIFSFGIQAENYKNAEDFFPNIAKESFAIVKEGRQITVKFDMNLNDAGQAAHYYNEKNEMIKCIISINPDFEIYTNGFHPSLSMGMDLKTIKNLFLLHEMGHCVDGELPPNGINLTAWREGFADAFAVAVLYQKNKIKYNQIKKFELFRTGPKEGHGSNTVLNYIANKINDDQISIPDLIKKIKEMRLKAFESN